MSILQILNKSDDTPPERLVVVHLEFELRIIHIEMITPMLTDTLTNRQTL